jgi:hypothetical protein
MNLRAIEDNLGEEVKCLMFGWDDGQLADAIKERPKWTLLAINGVTEMDENRVRSVIADSRLIEIKGMFDAAFIDATEQWAIINIYRAIESLVEGGALHIFNLNPKFMTTAWDLTKEGTMTNEAYTECKVKKSITFTIEKGKIGSI